VRHVAADARWEPFRLEGFRCRDTGIAEATGNLATVRVARATSPSPGRARYRHEAELLFQFVLSGSMTLDVERSGRHAIGEGAAFVLPPDRSYAYEDCSSDLELLEVALPARFETISR
jgi:mannose-6-phosphate isomerase-like protein (cupin superfamily)